MSDDLSDAALDAWIDAGTSLHGIAVEPAWREAIRLHLRITFGHARNVMAFELADEADPAPVYRT